jgi:hypothetical protein
VAADGDGKARTAPSGAAVASVPFLSPDSRIAAAPQHQCTTGRRAPAPVSCGGTAASRGHAAGTPKGKGVFGWLQADTVAAVWTAAAAIHREKNTVEAANKL